jgi:serine/threonine-protein kinase
MAHTTGSRGKLHLLGEGETPGTTRNEGKRKQPRPLPGPNDPTEAPTISAGDIKRKIQDAAASLSLDERFVDQGEIARGGMGAVHRVYEKSLGREVALKFLPPQRAANKRSRDRFLAEAQITGQLEHPNIIPVHELGQDDDGTFFFTMRLVEGETLTEFLEAGDDEEHLERALDVFFRACDALSFAHSRGVLHRDVKPSNIMVGEHGQVYLMDWGIAHVSQKVADETLSGEEPSLATRRTTTLSTPAVDDRGMVVGTYAYMSPEQARGDLDDMDARTDVFGLGAVLFRIVTGKPPFYAKTAPASLALATQCKVVDLESEVEGRLFQEMYRVAMQSMQKDKDARFQSVQALKRAVQGVLRGRQRFPSKVFAPGEAIVVEGETGDDAYFIRRGQCDVFRVIDGERRSLRMLGTGEVFGETAIFTGQPRNASISAITEVEVVIVPGRALSEALGLDSWMGAFVSALGNRFSERSQRVVELDGRAAKQRVQVRVLAHLARVGRREAGVDELSVALGFEPVEIVDAASECRELDSDGRTVRLV